MGNPLKIVTGAQPPKPPQKPQPTEREMRHLPDDDELAINLVEGWKGRYAYFYDNWHEYRDGMWHKLHDAQIQQEIRNYLRDCRRKHPRIRLSNKLIVGIGKMASLDCYIDSSVINNQPNYLNVRNGLVNLETLCLEKHRPDTYLTWRLDFDYDPDAESPHFIRYLRTSLTTEDEQVDERMIDLVQEAFGYSLTADTSRKVSFWVIGPKDSGKSTLLAFLRQMMGSMHGTVNLNDLAENKYVLSTLVGKRVVTCTESDAGSVLPDGIFKMLVGGEDEVQADVKHKDPITFVPQCKVWWGMNDMPRVRDRSGAVYRRILMVIFPRSLPQERQIIGLIDKLAEERSGVLNWAISGLLRLRRRGHFIEPAASQRRMDEFKLLNDPEALFVKECGILDASLRTQATDLHTAITAWRKANGYPSKSTIQVRKDLERLRIFRHKYNDANYYDGFALNDDGREYAGVIS